MKLRSAGLDDVFNELQFALDDDGRGSARVLSHLFTLAYRSLRAGMLLTLRLPWKKAGISAELARQAQLRRVDSVEGGALVGRNDSGDYAGNVYPNFAPGQDRPRENRLRVDRPPSTIVKTSRRRQGNICIHRDAAICCISFRGPFQNG